MDKHQQYKRVFSHFDENGDGKISPSELQQCTGALGGDLSLKEVEAAVGDGLLGLEEFVRFVEGSGEDDKDEKVNDLREAFKMYTDNGGGRMDGSGGGRITPTSLKRMLRRLGESRSTDECKIMISRFDLNGDGVLNFDEFKVMMM